MALPAALRGPLSFVLSLVLWLYFTVGYALLFLPRYLYWWLASSGPRRERAFQGLTHRFFAAFFKLARALLPGLSLALDPALPRLRGAVVVANHISFVDAILMAALLPRHLTIVKPALFRVPFMGWMFRCAGYISADPGQLLGAADRVEGLLAGLRRHLDDGGTLFVFPEGTRSKDGRLGAFKKGAFSLARRCRAPLVLAAIRNTDRLHARRTWWMFNAFFPNRVQVQVIARLEPNYDDPRFSQARLLTRARQTLATHLSEGEVDPNSL